MEQDKRCSYCNMQFCSINSNQYCSAECKHAAWVDNNKIKLENDPIVVKCLLCGKEFIKNNSTHKYCSPECRQIYTNHTRNKFTIFKRDNFRCIYCGCSSIENEIELHLDHLYPQHRGGEDTANNLITACKYCNLSKGDSVLPLADMSRIKVIINFRNERDNISPTLIIHF